MVRGEDCPVCDELAADEVENEHGFFVANLAFSRLRLSREQHVPGWCVLLCHRHVREPHELDAPQRHAFFDDMVRVGAALEGVYDALKINYAIMGNSVPHLHAHIQPRYYGDPYPGGPVSGLPPEPVHLSMHQYRQQISLIRTALGVDTAP